MGSKLFPSKIGKLQFSIHKVLECCKHMYRMIFTTKIVLYITLPMTLKCIKHHSSFLLFMTFYVAERPSTNVIWCFSRWFKINFTSEIESFNVSCELSQP